MLVIRICLFLAGLGRIEPNKRHFKYYDKKYNTATDVYLEYKFSDGHEKFMEKKGNLFLKYWKDIQKIVKKLVVLRNEMLNIYKDIGGMAEDTPLHMNFEKDDLSKSCEICKRLDGINFLNAHRVWEIPKKGNQDRYEGGELTEGEP